MKKKTKSLQETVQSLAPDLKRDDILAVLPTELDLREPMKKVKALAILTATELRLFQNETEISREALSELSGVSYRNGVGCVYATYQRANGEEILFARGTAKRRSAVSDFVRRANRAIRHLSQGQEERERAAQRKKTGRKQALLRLFLMAKKEWKHLAFTVLLFLLTTGIGLLIPYINKVLIDGYIQTDDPSNPKFLIGFLCVILAMLAANLLRRMISLLRGYVLAIAGNRFIVRLRDMVFHKIQELSISSISKQTSGELMKRVTDDTARIRDFIINQLPNLVEQGLLLVAVAVLLFWIDWRLALFIILPAPVVVFSFRCFWRLMRRLSARIRDLNARGNAVLHDVFSGIRVVKAYGMEEHEEKRFVSMAANERESHLRQEKIWAILMPILTFIMGLSEYVLLYYLGSQIIGGNEDFSVGLITQVSAYSGMIYAPLAMLIRAPRIFMHMMTSVSAIFDLLDEPNDVPDSNKVQIEQLRGRIELDRVSFGYDDADEVLHDVTLTIEEGEFIGLVGKSGVGKSTLINLIMRMYDVDDGCIRIDGNDIRDIPQHVLRSHMGVVLQENFLFAGTVWQNLTYAKPDATREEIIQAAKLAGAHEFIIRLPDAYQTYVGERGHTLSGGERQRIAIARALLHNPNILILDEATSALDTETEKLIQDALLELTKGRTTIAIAHRLSTLRNATRLVVMDEGRIAEVGTHDELMAKGGIYYGLVMSQREMSKME